MSEMSLSEAILAFNAQRVKVGKIPGDARKAKWWRDLAAATEELARRASRVADEIDKA